MKAWGRAALVAVAAYAMAVLHAELDERMKMAVRANFGNLAFHEDVLELTEEQVKRFDKDGFVVVRGLVPEETVKLLYANRPRSMIPHFLKPVDWLFSYLSSSMVSIDAIWAESSLFRNFWLNGPVPSVVSQLMHGSSVRLLTDIVYGIPKGSRPVFLGKWHKDSTSFDIVERDTASGISAWIPLVDIDCERDGGSIFLGNISIVDKVCQAEPDDECSEKCMKHLDQVANVYSFRRGDVLLFTDHTFHRSQPIKLDALTSDRFALVGRFVQADSTFKKSNSLEKQRKNFCNHGLEPGNIIHSPCFPQVFPRLEANSSQLIFPSGGTHIFSNIKDNICAAIGIEC